MAMSKEQLIIELKAAGVKLTTAQLKQLGRQTDKAAGKMKGLVLASAGMYALTAGFRNITQAGMEYTTAVSNLSAVTGASEINMQRLSKSARELGKETKFTAAEVTGLQTEFGKLGYTTGQIIAAQKATLSLAAAVNTDLSTAATIAGQTVNQFRLTASDTQQVVDVMAKSFSSSALDLEKFTNTMTYVGPLAGEMGISLEATTAVMAKLADVGIDGSIAGTAMRRVFLEMGNEASKLSKRVGFAVKSEEDMFKALKKLNAEGMTTTEMQDLVGKRAVTAFSAMLKMADGAEDLDEALQNAAGTAEDMADKQLDNLEGDLTKLNSATNDLYLDLSADLEPMFRSLTQSVTDFIKELDPATIYSYATAIGVATAGWVYYKYAQQAATWATKNFKKALVRTGIGALVIALGYAIDALGLFEDGQEEASDALRRAQEEEERLEAERQKQLETTRDLEQRERELAKIRGNAKLMSEEELQLQIKLLKKDSQQAVQQTYNNKILGEFFGTIARNKSLMKKLTDNSKAFLREVKELSTIQSGDFGPAWKQVKRDLKDLRKEASSYVKDLTTNFKGVDKEIKNLKLFDNIDPARLTAGTVMAPMEILESLGLGQDGFNVMSIEVQNMIEEDLGKHISQVSVRDVFKYFRKRVEGELDNLVKSSDIHKKTNDMLLFGGVVSHNIFEENIGEIIKHYANYVDAHDKLTQDIYDSNQDIIDIYVQELIGLGDLNQATIDFNETLLLSIAKSKSKALQDADNILLLEATKQGIYAVNIEQVKYVRELAKEGYSQEYIAVKVKEKLNSTTDYKRALEELRVIEKAKQLDDIQNNLVQMQANELLEENLEITDDLINKIANFMDSGLSKENAIKLSVDFDINKEAFKGKIDSVISDAFSQDTSDLLAGTFDAQFEMMDTGFQRMLTSKEQFEIDKLDAEKYALETSAEYMALGEEAKTKIQDFYSKKRQDLVKKEALATTKMQITAVNATLDAMVAAGEAVGMHAKDALNLKIIQAIANTYAGMNEALGAYPPPFGGIMAAAVAVQGFANVRQMRNQFQEAEAATGGPQTQVAVPAFAQGGTFTTSGPQLIMVGDNPSGAELVDIKPIGNPAASGIARKLSINISGNVLTEDFVEEHVIELLKDKLRRNFNLD